MRGRRARSVEEAHEGEREEAAGGHRPDKVVSVICVVANQGRSHQSGAHPARQARLGSVAVVYFQVAGTATLPAFVYTAQEWSTKAGCGLGTRQTNLVVWTRELHESLDGGRVCLRTAESRLDEWMDWMEHPPRRVRETQQV